MNLRRLCMPAIALSVAFLGCSEGDAPPTSGFQAPDSPTASGTASGGSNLAETKQLAKALHATVLDLPVAERKYVVDPKLTKTNFEGVTLAKDTVVVPSDALVQGAGSAGTQTFKSSALHAAGVKFEVGSVALVPGRLLGRVTAVSIKGDSTVVTTKFAALNEALADAKIAWDAPLPVSRANLAAFVMPDGREFPLPNSVQYAMLPQTGLPMLPQGPMEWSLADGPLTYKVALDAQQTYIDFQVQVTREMANTGGMTYTGKVRLKPVNVRGSGEIVGGKTKSIDVTQKELGGDIEISVAAAGAGRSEINKDLPMPLFKWIVMVGPIPVVIKARARLIGRVDLPVKGSSIATGKFSFGGEAGFKYEGGSVEAKAAFAKEDFKVDKAFDAAGFIGGKVDAQFGVAFPVLSMGMFDSFFVPEITPGAQLGVELTWGPVCKTGYLLYTLKAAYDFKVLGVSLSEGKKALYEKRKDSKGQNCRDK